MNRYTTARRSEGIDLDEFAKELGIIVVGEVNDLLEKADADVQEFLTVIINEFQAALQAGNSELSEELEAQLAAILELNKIRGAKALNATIRKVSNAVLKTAVVGLKTVLGGIF